jgi:uncharacterized protein
LDIHATFDALAADTGVPSVQATAVEQYVISPISFWCDLHAPPEERDPIDPYQQRLFEVGREHQGEVVEGSYPGAVRERFVDEEEGFRRTLEMMSRGECFITDMPLLSRPLGLEGRPDLLVRVDGVRSRLGDYSYAVVEIKSARHLVPGHLMQAAVYNRLLGLAQGYQPSEVTVINRDGDARDFLMGDLEHDLDDVLDRVRRVMAGEAVEPVYGAGRWPWESFVDGLAIERNDVSLLPGVGPAKRQGLVDAGFQTVDDVAIAQEDSLIELPGIGAATARKHIGSAMAIARGHPVRRAETPRLPTATTQVFFDLEGTDPRIGEEGLAVVNYLIGTIVRRPPGPEEFVSFFASSPDDEERNLVEFFEWAGALEDPVFYHWHHYERTHLRKMIEHYGLEQGLVAPVMDRLVDLSPITVRSFAFPCYGEGLKDIAKSIGFSWRQDDVSALTSVALYLDYVGSGGAYREARRKILDYNEDDCRATMHVYDWLLSQ